MRSHPLAAVAAVARRRASLRPQGLEAFFVAPGPGQTPGAGGVPPAPFWPAPSAFFAFRSEADREKVLSLLRGQPALGAAIPALASAGAAGDGDGGAAAAAAPRAAPAHAAAAELLDAGSAPAPGAAGAAGDGDGAAGRRRLAAATRAWRRGRLSNFDYLLLLNLAAGRSFNDLAQWPVFPWVLADYESSTLDLEDPATFRDLARPMGAQTPARLEDFRRRYRELEALPPGAGIGVAPFMYGTHYSAPGCARRRLNPLTLVVFVLFACCAALLAYACLPCFDL